MNQYTESNRAAAQDFLAANPWAHSVTVGNVRLDRAGAETLVHFAPAPQEIDPAIHGGELSEEELAAADFGDRLTFLFTVLIAAFLLAAGAYRLL